MNDILDIIVSRRSVKKFKSDMVEKQLIDKVLKAGISAPTGKNLQSPIILAVTNREVRDKLSKLCASVRGIDIDPFYNAPVVLVVLADKSVFTHIYDGSCVMENMLLEARSLGLGACWIHSAKQMFETSEGKELLKSLGINGDYEGIGNCILGYSAVKPIGEIKRKDNYIYYID
ncbi:MAG: nitroreductase [Clostridia bacterium]|nr:nitroreductase [Clostridia bacterium]